MKFMVLLAIGIAIGMLLTLACTAKALIEGIREHRARKSKLLDQGICPDCEIAKIDPGAPRCTDCQLDWTW